MPRHRRIVAHSELGCKAVANPDLHDDLSWSRFCVDQRGNIRARVEHVFAQQKAKMGMLIRTIGIKRAEAKITLVNLAYNMNRLILHERRAAMG